MCRWITGIAMGWLGLVTQCFAGMGEKQKKNHQSNYQGQLTVPWKTVFTNHPEN